MLNMEIEFEIHPFLSSFFFFSFRLFSVVWMVLYVIGNH